MHLRALIDLFLGILASQLSSVNCGKDIFFNSQKSYVVSVRLESLPTLLHQLNINVHQHQPFSYAVTVKSMSKCPI